MADISLGDVVAKLKADSSEFTKGVSDATKELDALSRKTAETSSTIRAQLNQSIEQARQQLADMATKSSQTRQALSSLPLTAVQTAIDQFSKAILAAGNNQTKWQEAIKQGQQALAQFGVTTNASGEMVDRFGERLSKAGTESIRQFATGIREAQGELAQLQKFGIDASAGVDTLSSSASTIKGILSGLGISLSIAGLVGFTKSIVDTGIAMDRLRTASVALAGSQADGQKILDTGAQIADKYGLAVKDVTGLLEHFLAAAQGTAMAGKPAQEFFEGLTTAIKATGGGIPQLAQAISVFERAMASGTMQGRQLRTVLTEDIPGGFDRFAKAIGIPNDKLLKFLTDTQLGTDVTLPAFAKMLQTYTAAAEEAAQKTEATLGRSANAWTRYKDAVFANLAEVIDFFAKKKFGAVSVSDFLGFGSTEPQLGGPTSTGAPAQFLTSTPPAQTTGTLTSGALVSTFKDLKTQLDDINRAAGQTPGLFSQTTGETERLQQRLAAVQEILTRANLLLRQAPPGEALTAEAQAVLTQANAQAVTLQNQLGSVEQTTKLRDLLKSQADQLQLLSIRREADLLIQTKGQEAADEFARRETAAMQSRNVGADAATAKLPLAQQISMYQAQVSTLAAKAQGLADQQAEAQMGAAVGQVQMVLGRQQEQAIATLERLTEAYTHVKEARDEDTISALMTKFPDNEEIQTKGQLARETVHTVAAYKAEVEALKERFTALKQSADATRIAEAAEDAYTKKLQDALTVLRTPAEQRQSARLATQAPATGATDAQKELLNRIAAQERLNYATKLFEELGNSVGSAWGTALSSIAQGTSTVAAAFRTMAQSILQSMAQIASQEAFKSLIKLGVGLIGNAFAPNGSVDVGGTFAGAGVGSNTVPYNPPPLLFGAQGGAIINKPTAILAGESPGVNPEYVINTPQMKALMSSAFQAGPSAGGQASHNIAIINVANRDQAEQEAIKQRQQGRQVIINEVLQNMSQGENSPIVRMMRTLSR